MSEDNLTYTIANGGAIAGVDYSINSPCVCIFDSEDSNPQFSINDCYFYLISVKKSECKSYLNDRIEIHHRNITHEPDFSVVRYMYNAEAFAEVLTAHDCVDVGIEDYAYAASGRVFHIGENCGILKSYMTANAISYNVYSPSEIKRFATGKGNANKEAMYEAFEQETGISLIDIIYKDRKIPKIPIQSPVTDIIDAYYICKYQFYLGIQPE